MENMKEPAYPVDTYKRMALGLTKLEAFTMAAMQGLCASNTELYTENPEYELEIETLSKSAIRIAKETLKALEEDGKQI